MVLDSFVIRHGRLGLDLAHGVQRAHSPSYQRRLQTAACARAGGGGGGSPGGSNGGAERREDITMEITHAVLPSKVLEATPFKKWKKDSRVSCSQKN